MTKLTVIREVRARGGATAFTDGGSAPRWITAARVVMLLAFAATIPAVLGLSHGNRLLWTVLIAALPMFWTVAGYHVWRRICPLAVFGQTGRLLGRPGTRKAGAWISAHYLLVQLALMIACLTLRLVATNGSDVWLAGFLGAIAACALVTSFVYGGKTWCNFLCPIGMVEKIHTEPARSATAAGEAMTSQCSPCVACKKHCPDIDVEQGYWKEAGDPSRRIAYFAWPGVVVGFYVYFNLVSGGWDYYFSGAWAYERAMAQLATGPGWWFATSVPRIVAVPLTLVAFGAASYALFATIEAMARSAWRRGHPSTTDDARAQAYARIRHVMLAVAGFVAFNAFYAFAGQPTLRKLPLAVVASWNIAVVIASTAMLLRRIGRREHPYVR